MIKNYVRWFLYQVLKNIQVMIKKIMIILSLIMLMFSNSFAAELGPNLQIVESNINPNPVKPGNDLTIGVNILNSGNLMSNDVSIDVQLSDIFYFKESNLDKNEVNICGGCSYDASFYFSVKSNVKSGVYPITFNINHDNNQISTQTINVKVEGIPDIIIIEDNLHGQKLYASQEFELGLDLKNFGTSLSKNIKIKSSSESISKIGTNVNFINELDVGNKRTVINTFKIDENLNPGLYQIPFTIEFEDEFGNGYSNEYTIGVEILNKAEINIQYLKISEYQVNLFKSFEINGMIENIGFGEAKNVFIEVETPLEGFKKSFVGALDKNGDSPIQFKFKANEVGNKQIKLNIIYEDDFGTHSFSETIEVNVTKPTSQVYLVLSIIGILIVFVIFKVRSNKKK